ncbi:MAG: hypothetical protein AAF959_00160 [Cyanobacteria bacterium P01_D01_bin.56]
MELLFSLIAGLIIAFALQLLLANLGIALGLTALDFSPKRQQPSESAVTLPITHMLGFGVAFSLSTVLFAAGLLTTEFSEVTAPRRGAIFGIILWASYWLLFIWLSSSTLSSLADSLLGTALGSGRRLITTLGRGLHQTERAALAQLTEDVSELVKEQQQLSQQLVEQKEALIAEMETLAASPGAVPSENQTTDHITEAQVDIEPVSSPSSMMSRLNLPSGRQLLDRAMDQVPDMDVQTLWHQFRQNSVSASGQDAISQDVAAYLRQVPSWMFQPTVLKETFSERIYDPEASPEQIRTQLTAITRSHLVSWLQERGDLAAEQIETVADCLSDVKNSIMTTLSSVSEQPVLIEKLEKIQDKLVAYCRYTNLDLLTPDNLVEKIQSQLDEHAIANSANIVMQLNLDEIEAVLDRRQGLSAVDQQQLIKALRSALSQSKPLPAPRRWAIRSGQSAQDLSQRLAKQVGYYLQYQDKAALKPNQMARDLSYLAKASLRPLLEYLPDSTELDLTKYLPEALVDRHAWKQALADRRDMTTTEIQQLLTKTDSVWQETLRQIDSWTETAWPEVQERLQSKNAALLDAASHQISEGLSAAQDALSNRVDAVKTDLQIQADAARGQVAIAAWWLFGSLLLSGLSAAASGWLAAVY